MTLADRCSLFFDGESLFFLSGRGERLCARTAVILERMTLAVTDCQTCQTYARVADTALAFARNVAAGERGVFAVVDTEFGLAIADRIEYRAGAPTAIERVAEFAVDGQPRSAVADRDFLCATACGRKEKRSQAHGFR
jgi:hypothetical protein